MLFDPHICFHIGIIRLMFIINRQKNFLPFHSLTIKFITIGVFIFLSLYCNCKKQQGIFVISCCIFPFEPFYIIRKQCKIRMIKRETNTTIIIHSKQVVVVAFIFVRAISSYTIVHFRSANERG